MGDGERKEYCQQSCSLSLVNRQTVFAVVRSVDVCMQGRSKWKSKIKI